MGRLETGDFEGLVLLEEFFDWGVGWFVGKLILDFAEFGFWVIVRLEDYLGLRWNYMAG